MEPSLEDTAVVDDARVGEPDAHAPRVLRAGEQLGRYCVLSVLGAGAMGVVYAAYDPELDRRVAIKIIQPTHASADNHTRLLREAQALARLSHPNVVAVHDVDTHDGRVFVAMEFVAGQTLAELDWQALGWAEVVAIYRAAGRGLEAAHLAGLVHRDFKPANVMRRDDGRVVVMDFGLARAQGADETSSHGESLPAIPEELTASSSFDAHLTQTGLLLGTPAYMAPEQFAGAAADARSDQFAFCVSLYEALHGERPFRGESVAALVFSVTHQQIQPTPKSSHIPGSVRAALLRGLAASPTDRWPDMGALLSALSVDPNRRRTMASATVGGIALLGIVAAGAYALGGETRDDPAASVCTGAEQQLGDAWNDARRQTMHAHLSDLEVDYAATTAKRVSEGLDAYASDWIAMYTDACEATRVRGEQSGSILDLRMACLDRRRQELATLVEILEVADTQTLARSIQAVGGLSPIASCGDLDALTSVAPPPASGEVRTRVDEVRREIAKARALWLAAKYDEAQSTLEAAKARLPEEYPLVAAELGRIEGEVLLRKATYDEAETVLHDAYLLALRYRDLSAAGGIATTLSFLVGYIQGDYDRALDYADLAIALAEATADDMLRAKALGQKGIVFHAQEKLPRAIELYEAGIEALPDGRTSYDLDLAGRLYNLALARRDLGHQEEALAELQRAEALYTEVLGEGHPDTIDARDAIGTSLYNLGRLDEAQAVLEAALAARAKTLGPDHPEQFSTLTSLGNIAWERGDVQKSRRIHTQARELAERKLGPEHPNVSIALRNLGHAANLDGKPDEAAELFERALSIRKAAFGEDSVTVADVLVDLAGVELRRKNPTHALELIDQAQAVLARASAQGTESEGYVRMKRGDALLALGRQGDAEAEYRLALEVMRSAMSDVSPRTADAALGLAEVLMAEAKYREAIELLEHALAIRQRAGVAPAFIAEVQSSLASARAARGGEDAQR